MLDTLVDANAETLASIQQEKAVRKTTELFILFSLGSQFDHLIKQQLSELGVFCIVADPAKVTAHHIQQIQPTGIILSGGPASAYTNSIPFDRAILDLGIPVLGICLGFQVWAHHIGVEVTSAEKREFGIHTIQVYEPSGIFAGLPTSFKVLESHGDRIEASKKIAVLGSTAHAPISAGYYKHLWGVQFHPEVTDTEYGSTILENFCVTVCGAKDRYPAIQMAERKVAELAQQIEGKIVLLALSGGCDSSVVAYLLKEAAQQVTTTIHAVYIRGIDRPDDERFVHTYFGSEPWLSVTTIDATADFLRVLKGKEKMREKRVAMREVYKKVLEEEARKHNAHFIAQGTLYTDVSESGGGYRTGAEKAQIKLHHNVDLGFGVPELSPLIDCVKDTGRNIGAALGVPHELLYRHPFPGPGLVVRVEGEVTEAGLTIARQADSIYIEELRSWKLYDEIWQAGAVVTTSHVTCTKGDGAAEGVVVALWAVWSVNGFTARSAEVPYDFLRHVSQRLTNEIREVGAVVYRISDKPPATIEWG
jgi:GMP synthase (glutamine-hydrolysing)